LIVLFLYGFWIDAKCPIDQNDQMDKFCLVHFAERTVVFRKGECFILFACHSCSFDWCCDCLDSNLRSFEFTRSPFLFEIFFFFFFLLSSFFLLQHGTRSVWRRQTGEMTTVVETTHRVDSVANVNDRASSDSDERKQAAASPGGRRRPVEAEEENAALVMASFEEE
jgi:hypothetical protein